MILFTKTIAWKEEEEVRLLLNIKKNGSQYKKIRKDTVRRVIFGERMRQEDRLQVLTWVAARNERTALSEAITMGSELTIRDVHPTLA